MESPQTLLPVAELFGDVSESFDPKRKALVCMTPSAAIPPAAPEQAATFTLTDLASSSGIDSGLWLVAE